MAITREDSHVINAKNIIFAGTDAISISDNNSLDVTGNFTIIFHIQPSNTPSLIRNYAIFSKGHPTDPNLGSISCESVNGYLRFFLHDDATQSLVHESINPILLSNHNIHIAITWHSTNKIFKLYKDGVPVETQILSGGSYPPGWYSSTSSMGTINTNDSPFVWFNAAGKLNFKGKMKPTTIMSPTVWSGAEILNLYNSVKYDPNIHGPYPTMGKILYGTAGIGSVINAYEMNEDGSDVNQLTSLAYSVGMLEYNVAKTRFGLIYNGGRVYKADVGTGANPVDSVAKNASIQSFCYSPDDLNVIEFISGYSGFYDNIISRAASQISNSPVNVLMQLGAGNIAGVGGRLGTTGIIMSVAVGAATNELRKYNINSSGTSINTQVTLDTMPQNPGTRYYGQIKCKEDGSLVGYSKRADTLLSKYAIHTVASSGGLINQITDGQSNCHIGAFSPDGTKMVYTDDQSGYNQIWICNIDGSGAYPLTDDNFNYIVGGWR